GGGAGGGVARRGGAPTASPAFPPSKDALANRRSWPAVPSMNHCGRDWHPYGSLAFVSPLGNRQSKLSEDLGRRVRQGGCHATHYLHDRNGYTGFFADEFVRQCPAGQLPSARHADRSRQQ